MNATSGRNPHVPVTWMFASVPVTGSWVSLADDEDFGADLLGPGSEHPVSSSARTIPAASAVMARRALTTAP
ncbi:hypothetical protein GCM10010401_22210 [Rarobacter faecitabidus]